MPKISFEADRGMVWYSLLMKGVDSSWGDRTDTQHELVGKTEEYFEKHPLVEDLVLKVNRIKEEADNEIIFWFALVHEHPERKGEVLDLIEKHKGYKNIPEPEQLLDRFLSALDRFGQENQELAGLINPYIEEDLQEREGRRDKFENRTREIIDFFKPYADTTPQTEVVFLTTSFIEQKDTGRAVPFHNTIVVKSHIDNVDNQKHEFLHNITNPIVEKLSLTDEQEQKILDLSSGGLREQYEVPVSILQETLVRTYNDYFSKNEEPPNLESFQKKLDGIPEEKLQSMIDKPRNSGEKQRLEEMDITTPAELREKSEEYYDKYKKDALTERLFKIYEDYDAEKARNPNLAFEDFFLENFRDVLR